MVFSDSEEVNQMYDNHNINRKMDYYIDRCVRSDVLNIAEQCTRGDLYLWDVYYYHISNDENNIFNHIFKGDAITKREYLFTMDYLSCVLTGYKISGKNIYKKTFEKIIDQFYQYLKTYEPFYSDLPIYGQTLLFIKALDIFGRIPHQNEIFDLLKKYASWLMDDNNHNFHNNHGLLQDLALLHIGVLFEGGEESKIWKECAIKRINKLFEIAYYDDFTNNEHSITYFNFNNIMYERIVKFCNYYNIDGIKKIEENLEKSKKALCVFAHKDTSFPLIGDGKIFFSTKSNGKSALFPDLGMAVLKVDEVYLSFKSKTVFQSHAHTDISSITARYKNIDLLIDPGQYNDDRYSPISRFLLSSAGHSAVFPIRADSMFQNDFCKNIKKSGISVYEHNGDNARVIGEYQLDDLKVSREIFVLPDKVIVKDRWISERPVAMRQRCVIPKELIEHSRFTASRCTLESETESVKIKYEIKSDLAHASTTVNFGVAAPYYNNYETTMLLDTIVENTLSGEITAKISFWEE